MSSISKRNAAVKELNKAFKTYADGLTHFYDCIDFNKSHLDAQAVAFMITGLFDFVNAVKKIIGGL